MRRIFFCVFNNFSVGFLAILDESGKLSASSIAGGWEMIHSSSHNSSQDENWKQSMEGLPDVYEMHVDSPTNYSRKVMTSPLNIVVNIY